VHHFAATIFDTFLDTLTARFQTSATRCFGNTLSLRRLQKRSAMIEIEMIEQRMMGSINQPPDFTNSNTFSPL
jgi:hypothetical protein